MDSLSQALLGASMAGIVAPRHQRRKALLIGAALGTLPDLDVIIDYGDAVRNFTFHRGFSHSLFVLAPAAVVIWLALLRCWTAARSAPLRWLVAISLALITHPLLDAHTAYGTQLFWPLDVAPTMWATLFIIDPAYTLPLFIGVLAVTFWPDSPRSFLTFRAGIALSVLYVGWSWLAQGIVVAEARTSLAAAGEESAVIFATPTPLNTLLWRIVVVTDDQILEGFDSLLLDEGGVTFQAIESDAVALAAADSIWAVRRLRWFSQDFLKATVNEDTLILSDLRMGSEPAYVFSHIVAQRSDAEWRAVVPRQLPFAMSDRSLGSVWRRIWSNSDR